jgi:hypothetical protein
MFYRKIKYEGYYDISFFFSYLFGVDFGIIPSLKVNQCLKKLISLPGGWNCFCLVIFFLFYFVKFEGVAYCFNYAYSYYVFQKNHTKYFRRGFFYNFILIFFFRKWGLWCILWNCCDRDTRHASRKTWPPLPCRCWVNTTCCCEYPKWNNSHWSIYLFLLFILFILFLWCSSLAVVM